MVTNFLLAIVFAVTANAGRVELKPGDKAPDFTAEASNGQRISLHEYHGKSNVILYFYPADLSKGCSIEACKFRDYDSKFKEAHTVILGVSLNSMEQHKQFVKSDSLNFPLLLDQDSVIARAYGVPIDFGKYVARWTFLIGKDGKIIQTYHDVDPRTHNLQLLRDIWAYNKKHPK